MADEADEYFVSPSHWAILTIIQEARGESQAGRTAVGEVIRNRMRRRYSSDGSVAGTVMLPNQFSGWNTHDPNRISVAKLKATDPVVVQCSQAWAASIDSNLTLGAVLYYNPAGVRVTPSWVRNVKPTVVIGRHHFFTI